MSAHAPLAPSSAPMWGICSGSVFANLQAPDIETEQNRAGEAAHWVGEQCLEAWKTPGDGCPTAVDWLGRVAPNGVVIDEKMVEGAQELVTDVLHIAQKHGALQDIMLEHRVHMPQIHPDNWGTFDVAIICKDIWYIWDYKHGHREVRAKGNLQLIDYVAGMVNETSTDGLEDQEITVVMRIVQPFCYSAVGTVDEWRVQLSDLRGYFNQLHAKAHEAFNNPTLYSGLHCRDCAAVGKCATARRSSYSMIDYVNEPYEIDTMGGSELAIERAILKRGVATTKARLDAIGDELAHRIRNGASDTGLSLETKPGRLKWTVEVGQAIALADMFQIDARKTDVLTPAQVIAAAPKELKAALTETLKTMTTRPAGSLQLIDADDTIGARAFKRKT